MQSTSNATTDRHGLDAESGRPREPHWFYAVVAPHLDCVFYCGDSLANAAYALVAGTWHGKGLTRDEAIATAWKAAEMARTIQTTKTTGAKP